MAQGLQLEIYSIAIKKRNSKVKEFLNFQYLFDTIQTDKDKAYHQFISDFRGIFDGKFKSDIKGTKSISTPKDDRFKFRSNLNIIDGSILGGAIGSVQEIYNQEDANKKVGEITKDQIASLPFYVKLWTPYDHNSGILMVQSYTSHTVTELIRKYLKDFFASYGFTLSVSSFIPEVIKKEYLKKSHVYEMKIINNKISRGKRKIINPIFAEYDKLKIEVKISGFEEDVASFWDKFRKGNKKLIGADLNDLDINEENGYDIKAFYKDDKGHRANVSMKNIMDFSPTIFLPNELKQQDDHFNFERIKEYTDGILNQIKLEIKYR